jgi:hypothetical protein
MLPARTRSAPHSPYPESQMIGTDDRAFGAGDVAGAFYTAGQRLRKLRFLMTDNNSASAQRHHQRRD